MRSVQALLLVALLAFVGQLVQGSSNNGMSSTQSRQEQDLNSILPDNLHSLFNPYDSEQSTDDAPDSVPR
eukprot:jgi/Chrzof1/10352/Cz04g38260.t1